MQRSQSWRIVGVRLTEKLVKVIYRVYRTVKTEQEKKTIKLYGMTKRSERIRTKIDEKYNRNKWLTSREG